MSSTTGEEGGLSEATPHISPAQTVTTGSTPEDQVRACSCLLCIIAKCCSSSNGGNLGQASYSLQYMASI